ncbi:MAG TPA: class I SAM-dependent methyltransferase [Candidatus Binatus sp.]|uniref:O-methyltransferase n=1 Tax=Candidatus Binatus sp. TaxID=2811406 RepID=UPI002B4922CB|nr:class I SAM-dependent methyltransferase [Candidatus Binatus sp.]HKN12588.1 class I SAM-dependent methyltransferase [Candidatus Binatus sp.]
MAGHSKFIALTPKLYEYVEAHGHNGDPLRAELAAETAKLGWISAMQIAAEQGTFMGLLAAAIGAHSAVEVGTFTGYSALCVARALPADGKLLCCDVNQEWTSVGRRYWERAGVANKITLKLGPAADTLRALPASHTFDFAFIDADKTSYAIYYEEILKRMRPNGLILIDNVLWNGAIVDDAKQDADTQALRKLNDFIAKDTRVEAVILGIADGLTIVRKK